MSLPIVNARDLFKDTAQAVFYNTNTDAAVIRINVVNRGTQFAKIALAITNTQTLPTSPAEYVEYGTRVEPKGSLEITGVIIPPGFYVVAYSSRSLVNVVTYGLATGDFAGTVAMPTVSATTLTETGLEHQYDPAHIFSRTSPTAVLEDAVGQFNTTVSGSPTFVSATQSYNYNGTTDWFSADGTTYLNMPTVDDLWADAGQVWSLEAWFRFPTAPTTTRVGNAAHVIANKGGGLIGGAETLTLFVSSATDTSNNQEVPHYLMLGLRGSKTVISTAPVNTNTWNQVVITWNGTTGNAYLNGAFRTVLNVGTAAVQTGIFRIGTQGDINGAYEGGIGPVRLYSTALSLAEVAANFNFNRVRFGL
jgi:hypothetical protein